MEFNYNHPQNDQAECEFLQNNFLQCLHEKSLSDQLPSLKCQNEQLIWFILRCPNYFRNFEDPHKLKEFHQKYYSEVDWAQAKQEALDW